MCCQFIPSHTHILTILVDLIFNKMALIFLGILIVFTVSSFEFQQVKLSYSGVNRVGDNRGGN